MCNVIFPSLPPLRPKSLLWMNLVKPVHDVVNDSYSYVLCQLKHDCLSSSGTALAWIPSRRLDD
eukprot:56379-Hanusia_phi.AAC.1